jgi:hypothetical protein
MTVCFTFSINQRTIAAVNVRANASRATTRLLPHVNRVTRAVCGIAVGLLVVSPVNGRAQTPTRSNVKAITQPAALTASAPTAKPSRAASKGCKWEAASGAGLSAWVERCDYGDVKIDLFFKGNMLMQRYSDRASLDTLIEVLDMLPNETQSAAMTRVYDAHTSAKVRSKCMLAPYKNGGKPPAGAEFYTFLPTAKYAKSLGKVANGDLPEPPCGDWGTMPDGIQYFEVWPANSVRKILMVRVGQDTPMFDERTLQLKP